MEKLYTMETLAEYLGVSVRTILREKAAGKVGFKRIRGQVRFSQEDIDSYLNNNSYVFTSSQGQEINAKGGIKLFNKPRNS